MFGCFPLKLISENLLIFHILKWSSTTEVMLIQIVCLPCYNMNPPLWIKIALVTVGVDGFRKHQKPSLLNLNWVALSQNFRFGKNHWDPLDNIEKYNYLNIFISKRSMCTHHSESFFTIFFYEIFWWILLTIYFDIFFFWQTFLTIFFLERGTSVSIYSFLRL